MSFRNMLEKDKKFVEVSMSRFRNMHKKDYKYDGVSRSRYSNMLAEVN